MSDSPTSPDLDALLEHSGWVRALARSLVSDPATAEDVEQKTWLAAMERPPRHTSNPKAWLGRVVRNIVGMHWREQHARQRREELVGERREKEEVLGGSEPDAYLERMETFQRLAMAMVNLPEPYGATLYLRFHEELTIREVAERMRISESVAQAQSVRGMELLRQQLNVSLGKDWRAQCLVLAAPLSAAPAGGLLKVLGMTTKMKISISAAAVLLVSFIVNSQWNPHEDLAAGLTPGHSLSYVEVAVDPGTHADDLSLTRSPYFEKGQASGSSPAAVSLTVVDPNGVGVVGVRVIPWLGSELQTEAFTGQGGEVVLSGLAGEGGVVLIAPDYLPVLLPQEFDGSTMRAVVGEGAVFSGKVTFGDQANNGTTLHFDVVNEWDFDWEGIPESILQQLLEVGVELGKTTLDVDEQGEFALYGLPVQWHGSLNIPPGFLLYEYVGPGEMKDSDPGSRHRGQLIEHISSIANVSLHLMKLPTFTGRVVTPDKTEGVAGAKVWLVAYMTNSRHYPQILQGSSDEGGYFHLPLTAPREQLSSKWIEDPTLIVPNRIDVSASGSQEWANSKTHLEIGKQSDPWNLGDFSMNERLSFPIRVTDSAGKALEGAVSYASAFSDPTDELGMGRVHLIASTEQFMVGAKGYESVQFPAPATLDEVFDVALPSTANLHVAWELPDGTDISALQLRIASEGHVLGAGEFPGSSGEVFLRHFGFPLLSARHSGDRKTTTFDLYLETGQKELTIWGVKPNTPMKAMLVDALGNPIVSSESFVVAPSKDFRVELEAEISLFTLQGVVQDAKGNPLPGVDVSLADQGNQVDTKTTQGGKFRFSGFHSPMVDISFEKRGYSTPAVQRIPVDNEGRPFVFIMEETRDVLVTVKDSAGAACDGSYFKYNRKTVGNTRKGQGGLLLHDLPAAGVTLEWFFHGKVGEVTIPADLLEYSLQLPVMSSVHINATRKEGTSSEVVFVSFVPMSDKGEVLRGYHYQRDLKFEKDQLEKEFTIPCLVPGQYQVQFRTGRISFDRPPQKFFQEPENIEALPGQLLELYLEY